ncbi:hypothetical protein E5F05_11950 [Deinococcus metallilatus]|uniref:3D (Asp-Asp-Asp) domain-containing protein n=1 Tax=Deinococcus metallilatus TaxID=1211322 RepID=A0AAJ5F0G1_9DEIO|nr:3D domain-containing protein [Deinococcus metallilatus]MBB5295252.1 3D (Asp-Asp-Asp) domain-containing protein [Deinococcus metallilatus]QBY08587.1 hypothetical protein E5F05_11950 [Deinococcus metallilatus]RXJ10849.1 hypothetical protein ERJ73_10775 [Deinococcus metallilatus]TLK22184.1 hypothetical protein FCS05_18210 [Deinococcus metallilatus]GMA15026.1 hypothetical protein GCM10025871_13570 [Deinococcus metallilatus]
MPYSFNRWMSVILLSALGTAAATPALPAPSLVAQAVRDALTPPAPAVPTSTTPAAAQPATSPAASATPAPAAVQQADRSGQTQAARAAQARALTVQLAQEDLARSTTRTGRSAVVRATAYNSTPGQTDATPFITATGTRVRSGVVALSRDMLRLFPYGSKIMIEDLSGRYNNLFRGRVFTVEDTMAARKTGSLDVWMSTRSQAIQFGARQVRITAVR